MRPLGVVLSLFWVAFVGFGSWYGLILGSPYLDWLVRLVSVPIDKLPNTAPISGFGLYWQLVDPVPLALLMLIPLIVAWVLAGLVTWLAR